MPPDPSSATPAPIHDIVGPVEIVASPFWWLAGVGLLIFLTGLIVWAVVAQMRRPRSYSPRERALLALAVLKTGQETPYELAVGLSDLLRRYVDEAFGIRATTATSLEFLTSIRDNPLFSEGEKTALAEFLITADLLKFARVDMESQETEQLLKSAEDLIRGVLSVVPREGEAS